MTPHESLLRELAPQVLGAVIRRFGDFSASEDAVQEALIAAADQWPRDGVPDDARAWLIRVAARRMVDHVRAEAARKRREQLVVSLVPAEEQLALPRDEDTTAVRDDTLSLLFMCCHPALSSASAIALTLRAVGGLTTLEIAKAFLVPEATMAQRISRAKQSVKASGVPFALPDVDERQARLSNVLHVLYLIFNEGYTASSGHTLARTDLSNEAMRLTRLLKSLVPSDHEITGLLALMLLTDARRLARSGPNGELITLDEQDRSLWDRAAISEGMALLTEAMSGGSEGASIVTVGQYQLQAAIAALHDQATSTDTTDWSQIVGLYELWMHTSDSPLIALNHAIALAMVEGPEAGLARIDNLAGHPQLTDNHRVDAVRAHLYARAGRPSEAITHYERAAARTTSTPERNYLLTQAAKLRDAQR